MLSASCYLLIGLYLSLYPSTFLLKLLFVSILMIRLIYSSSAALWTGSTVFSPYSDSFLILSCTQLFLAALGDSFTHLFSMCSVFVSLSVAPLTYCRSPMTYLPLKVRVRPRTIVSLQKLHKLSYSRYGPVCVDCYTLIKIFCSGFTVGHSVNPLLVLLHRPSKEHCFNLIPFVSIFDCNLLHVHPCGNRKICSSVYVATEITSAFSFERHCTFRKDFQGDDDCHRWRDLPTFRFPSGLSSLTVLCILFSCIQIFTSVFDTSVNICLLVLTSCYFAHICYDLHSYILSCCCRCIKLRSSRVPRYY